MQAKLMDICSLFRVQGEFKGWEQLMVGNINKTYKVFFSRENSAEKAYILQQVNTYVFKQPEQVMENIEKVTQHIRESLPGRVSLHYHHTKEGKNFVWDGDSIWRLCNYIPCASEVNYQDPELVRNGGYAFGEFQCALFDLAPEMLHETIPNFHHTLKRYEALEKAVEEAIPERLAEMQPELKWLLQMKETACRLCRMQDEGELPLRVIHNDTKANNVLFDKKNHRALCVIDLDTVMPGLIGHDFGEAIRFLANTAHEDEQDLSLVGFNEELFGAFTEGYLEPLAKALTEKELETLGLSCLAMTIEEAVRFLTDYLQGDPYFYCAYPEHNRSRTRCQICFAKVLMQRMDDMNRIIRSCAEKYR